MDFLIVCLAALIASGLTLFSGFGLGTILTPVSALAFSGDDGRRHDGGGAPRQ